MTAAPPVSARLPSPGDVIAGKYVLDRLLGQGGMGAVFAARHIKLSKPVAIKIMLADANNPEAAARFINEGRAAANIQNEHVVRVDDVDEEMGYAYMVLELLDGEDLSQVLEKASSRRLAPHVAAGYVLEALKGVAQAHAIGIVHRDLKPSNLFLAKRKDGSVVVKVLDFGISKAQGSSALAASPNALTSTKAMLGSPLYMSPEQLRSSKSVDHRADVWAIGVILYELITGNLPFMGETLGELFAAILETEPASLRVHVPTVPPGLDEVVLRCLRRRPEERFQTASEVAQALAPFVDPNASARIGAAPLVQPEAQAGPIGPPAWAASAATTGPELPRPQYPSASSITGAGGRLVGGTVAIGAMTPQQGLQQTTSGWQSSGTNLGTLPTSKAPVVVGAILAFMLVLGGVVAVAFVVVNRGKAEATAAASGSESALPLQSPPAEQPLPSKTSALSPSASETTTALPKASEVPPVASAPSSGTTSTTSPKSKAVATTKAPAVAPPATTTKNASEPQATAKTSRPSTPSPIQNAR